MIDRDCRTITNAIYLQSFWRGSSAG